MRVDLCFRDVCLLVVWCAKSRYSDLVGDLSNGYGMQGAGVGVCDGGCAMWGMCDAGGPGALVGWVG